MHVPPHRPVGIVLVKEMPYPVEEEHPVRIVHPPVCRGEMVRRTIVLLGNRITVRGEYFLPGNGFPMVIHHTDTVGFGIVGRAERHEIIHLELREPDAEGLHLTLAVEYFEGYFGRPLLNGEHDVLAASGEG